MSMEHKSTSLFAFISGFGFVTAFVLGIMCMCVVPTFYSGGMHCDDFLVFCHALTLIPLGIIISESICMGYLRKTGVGIPAVIISFIVFTVSLPCSINNLVQNYATSVAPATMIKNHQSEYRYITHNAPLYIYLSDSTYNKTDIESYDEFYKDISTARYSKVSGVADKIKTNEKYAAIRFNKGFEEIRYYQGEYEDYGYVFVSNDGGSSFVPWQTYRVNSYLIDEVFHYAKYGEK